MMTDRARTEILPNAELSVTRQQRHLQVRRAGQVIICLLLSIGLATAVAFVMLYMVLPLVGRPAPGSVPHPVPAPQATAEPALIAAPMNPSAAWHRPTTQPRH